MMRLILPLWKPNSEVPCISMDAGPAPGPSGMSSAISPWKSMVAIDHRTFFVHVHQLLLARSKQGRTDPGQLRQLGLAVGRHTQLVAGVMLEAHVIRDQGQHALDVEVVVRVDIGIDEGAACGVDHGRGFLGGDEAWRSRKKSMNTRSLRGTCTRLG